MLKRIKTSVIADFIAHWGSLRLRICTPVAVLPEHFTRPYKKLDGASANMLASILNSSNNNFTTALTRSIDTPYVSQRSAAKK